ncbi:MAG: aldo/keto reductase [Chitinophagaceae bacterium]|nr:aldo/keto reductase [Chitinophagaceae bacterium]
MIYSTLGTSDLNVSRIGYGCMSLSTNEKESISLLHMALDLGINFWDTANIYNDGVNETIIGKALKGIRDKVIVATKAGNVRRPDGGLDWNPSKQHILTCAEESLKRLDIDVIDLYQLHGGTIQDNIDETIEAFEQLKREGKIRYYGISSIRPNVIREYIKRSSIVSVMTQYSLLDRRPEEETLDLLNKNKIGVLVRGAVAQGLLINKPAKKYLDHSENDVSKAAKAVSDLSVNRTATQTSINYVLQHPAVTCAVVGMRTSEQIRDAVKTIQAPLLSPNEITFLQDATTAIRYKEHR